MVSLGTMPLINDYSLCRQAVTVYHFEDGAVTRAVHAKAFLDYKKALNVERTGSEEASGFLLVVPGNERACSVGDKVMAGEGPDAPEGDAASWWRSFIPSKVEGLVVVKYVDVKFWNGEICHTEAGG